MKTSEVAVMLTLVHKDDLSQDEVEQNVMELIRATIEDNDGSFEITVPVPEWKGTTPQLETLAKITNVELLECTLDVGVDA